MIGIFDFSVVRYPQRRVANRREIRNSDALAVPPYPEARLRCVQLIMVMEFFAGFCRELFLRK